MALSTPRPARRPLFPASSLVLALLCAMSLIFYVDRVNVATAATAFGAEFKLSNAQIGFVFSAYAYPYFVLQIIGGWLADRYGPRRTLAICSFIWSTATVLCGFAGGFGALVAARLLLGTGEGAALPASTRAMASWVAPSRRGFAQGITHACSRLGNALTPPLVSWLMILAGWRTSFLIIGAASFVWTVAWFLYFRDDPRRHPAVTAEEAAALAAPAPPGQTPPVPWGPLLRRMGAVAAAYFCYGWVLWLYLSWLPIYFIHQHRLNLKDSALFSGGVFFAGVVGDWLGGELTDRLARRRGLRPARCGFVSLCMIGTAAALLPIFIVPHLGVTAVAGLLSLGMFCNELCIGPMWCVPMDIAPAYSGTASGIMNAGGAVAAMLSPLVSGWIIDASGNWNLPFILAIALALTGSVLAWRMRPERGLDQDPARPAGLGVGSA